MYDVLKHSGHLKEQRPVIIIYFKTLFKGDNLFESYSANATGYKCYVIRRIYHDGPIK